MKIKTLTLAVILCHNLNTAAQARYYDPEAGRFISADSVISSWTDPQSHNRFSYVRNNPLKFTDPSGHSWVSKNFNKVKTWIRENPEWTGLIVQTFDPFTGSVQLARTERGRAILLGQALAGASFGLGGTAAGWGAITGGAPAGFAADKSGENIYAAVAKGAIQGAVTGYTFSGITNMESSWVAKGIIKANINAMITAAEGGSMENVGMAWAFTFAAEGANAYFTKIAGTPADPTPGISLDKAKGYTYTPNSLGQPEPGKDVFGRNNGLGGVGHQGHPAMRTLSSIPGMNSVAQLHDTWMYNYPKLIFGNPQLTNWLTMPPAFVVSYAAQLSTSFAPLITNSGD